MAAQPTSQTLATTTTSTGGGSKNVGSKLGLAWPNGDWASSTDPNYIGNYIGDKVSWYYTWSPFSVVSLDDQMCPKAINQYLRTHLGFRRLPWSRVCPYALGSKAGFRLARSNEPMAFYRPKRPFLQREFIYAFKCL